MNEIFHECRELELIHEFAPISKAGTRSGTWLENFKKNAVDWLEMLRWDIEQIPAGEDIDGDYTFQVRQALSRVDALEEKVKQL